MSEEQNWNGYPPNPERDGWHIVEDRDGLLCVRWDAHNEYWVTEMRNVWLPNTATRSWVYVEPDDTSEIEQDDPA